MRGLKEFGPLERDFDGHVLNKRIHLIIIAAMRMMMGVSSRRFSKNVILVEIEFST